MSGAHCTCDACSKRRTPRFDVAEVAGGPAVVAEEVIVASVGSIDLSNDQAVKDLLRICAAAYRLGRESTVDTPYVSPR